MPKKTILIIEDNQDLRETLTAEFEDRNLIVVAVESFDLIPLAQFDFAVVDLRLKNDNGIHCVEKIKFNSPNCRIVMLTGYPSLATAVEAVKKGAFHYLTKPVNISQLENALFEKQIKSTNISQSNNNNHPTLAKHEREYIEYILAESNGNITLAAKKLGLHRQSLQRKLKKYPPLK